MKRIITCASLLISALSIGQAGAPASPYYNGFNWNLTGMSLKNALTTKVISTHSNILTYQQAENAIKITDLDPADATNQNVLLLYGFSSNMCPSSMSNDKDHRRRNKNDDGGGTSCEWNREHTYPKSLGSPDLGETGPGADAHHLRSCDVDRNSDRGSQKFADGSGDSGDVTESTWYPGDEWKGDVARMMMYMYLRYGVQCLPKNVGVGNTLSTDSNMIGLFLQWNAEDPVSALEDQRNTYLGNANNNFGQGNRNPFIDNPYLATLIWGGSPAENRWPTLSVANPELLTTTSVIPNPARENQINVVADAVIDSLELINLNGQSVIKISNPVQNGTHYSIDNVPTGFYILRLSSEGTTAVRKVIVTGN